MGDMSWLMEIISLPAESGRSPRLPGSNTVEFSQDLCAFASLRLCVNFFLLAGTRSRAPRGWTSVFLCALCVSVVNYSSGPANFPLM